MDVDDNNQLANVLKSNLDEDNGSEIEKSNQKESKEKDIIKLQEAIT